MLQMKSFLDSLVVDFAAGFTAGLFSLGAEAGLSAFLLLLPLELSAEVPLLEALP